MKKQAKSLTLSPAVLKEVKRLAEREMRSESQVVDLILREKLLGEGGETCKLNR